MLRPCQSASLIGFGTKRPQPSLPAGAWAEMAEAVRPGVAAIENMTDAAPGHQIDSECLIMPDTRPGRPSERRIAC